MGDRYHLERIVASSAERVLFQAQDELLKRPVSLRVNFYLDDAVRAWFMRESEALGQLDDPGILHIYDAGVVRDLAYRVGNWVDGEGLRDAVRRGPRPIPVVLALARDLLGALEHAHLRGIILRSISPRSVMVSAGGRATVTDLRHCSYCLQAIPSGVRPSAPAFMAPEVRDGAPGDAASDIYAVGALLYFAVTGQEPALDPAAVRPPTELRPACPRVIERIVLRALRPQPQSRYFTAAEMLEDFASDAGTYDNAPTTLGTIISADEDRAGWEQRLRRALGDDYELLELLGTGGFGRVYRVRDLHLERLVALKVLHPALIRDPSVVERFRREAQLAARLDHPNIVNIYEIGGRSGLIWYTMELIDGPSLAQLVAREGPLPLDQVLRLLREGLSALAHAHGLGLVHRDIKPENLLHRFGRQPPDHGLRAGARASAKVRGRHQPERDAPVREPRAAPGGAGGPALGPLQPGGRRVLRSAGATAFPRPHPRAGARSTDHRPVARGDRAAGGRRSGPVGGARSRAPGGSGCPVHLGGGVPAGGEPGGRCR